MSAKLIQLTNLAIGSVSTGSNMPLGVKTLVYPSMVCNGDTYTTFSSLTDLLVVNRAGTYKVIYNASLVATAAGDVVLELVVNGSTKYTATVLAVEGAAVNVTIPYEVYIPCNCAGNPNSLPANISIVNSGVAITSGESNLIISRE